MKNRTLKIDHYPSLRLIMWSFPRKKTMTRKEAYEHFTSKWEYVFLRSLEDQEIELINSLIDEFGSLIPKYRTFQTYGADLPYTEGRLIERVTRPSTPTIVRVADYPQLQKSALSDGISAQEMTCNEAFLRYTYHWYDMIPDSMDDRERLFLNKLIYEFGPILPSINPDDENDVGEPIICV